MFRMIGLLPSPGQFNEQRKKAASKASACKAHSSALKMDAVNSFEMYLTLYQTTRRRIREEKTRHSHFRENLKPHKKCRHENCTILSGKSEGHSSTLKMEAAYFSETLATIYEVKASHSRRQ
jgi:hypothetical protein